MQVEWKPFQIDPNTALEGEEFEAYCQRRWGSSGWTRSLRQQGKQDGVRFANWKWWPHTLKVSTARCIVTTRQDGGKGL